MLRKKHQINTKLKSPNFNFFLECPIIHHQNDQCWCNQWYGCCRHWDNSQVYLSSRTHMESVLRVHGIALVYKGYGRCKNNGFLSIYLFLYPSFFSWYCTDCITHSLSGWLTTGFDTFEDKNPFFTTLHVQYGFTQKDCKTVCFLFYFQFQTLLSVSVLYLRYLIISTLATLVHTFICLME